MEKYDHHEAVVVGQARLEDLLLHLRRLLECGGRMPPDEIVRSDSDTEDHRTPLAGEVAPIADGDVGGALGVVQLEADPCIVLLERLD